MADPLKRKHLIEMDLSPLPEPEETLPGEIDPKDDYLEGRDRSMFVRAPDGRFTERDGTEEG